MSYYLYPLKVSILFFFVLIQFIAIPILIYQYNKEGALTFTKGLIIYSFIFYMITAFFMTLLPLPSHEFVNSLSTPYTQPVPFMFVFDLIKESSFKLFDISTYLKALTEPVFLQVVFNVLMTLPFGVYLRYYFKKDLKTVIGLTFLLSLFYEITQITGVYGLYSRPYRLFDVDDLMLNTLGGVLGYQLAPFILYFFPTKEELQNRVHKASFKIPVIRRLLAFYIDYFILTSLIGLIFGASSLMTVLLSSVILSLMNVKLKNQSIGLSLMNLKFVSEEGSISFKSAMKRNGSFYIVFNLVFIFSMRIFEVLNTQYYQHSWMIFIYIVVMFSAQIIVLSHLMINGLILKKPLFHERYSKTHLINTYKKEGELNG